jgi:hypothetical protein
MNEINIIDFKFNLDAWTFSLVVNLWLLLLGIALYFLIRFIVRYFKKTGKVHQQIVPVKLKFKMGGSEIEYSINRNFQNIEIAHRIYTELITRNAAILIDNNDVIIEVYNSWYTLFQATREELKKLSGEMLLDNQVSKDLIKLLSDILNIGLRPHLTEHQAKFRKWYNNALTLKENKDKTPQQIQSEYSDYENLFESMKAVNQILYEYSIRLDEIINGKKNGS